jgi:hypothetical protein
VPLFLLFFVFPEAAEFGDTIPNFQTAEKLGHVPEILAFTLIVFLKSLRFFFFSPVRSGGNSPGPDSSAGRRGEP